MKQTEKQRIKEQLRFPKPYTDIEQREGFVNGGERVTITDEKRNIGHGEQVKVIYSDDSTGWHHVEDIEPA